MATYSFYEYSPPSTPPPEYWAVIEEKPPIPPKSARRTSISRSSYECLMPTSCIPTVPPLAFTMLPYTDEKQRVARKPLPLPPREVPPPPLSFAPLTPPPSLASPTFASPFAPTSPTPSLRSLASSASSASSSSTPSRYRHRGGPPAPRAASSASPSALPAPVSRAVPSVPRPAPIAAAPLSPPPPPRRTLRRTSGAHPTDLRALRAMESEACLRAAYEGQVNAYLDGSIMLGAFGMGVTLEGIEE